MMIIAFLAVFAGSSFGAWRDNFLTNRLTALSTDENKAQPEPTASPKVQPEPTASPGAGSRAVRFRFLVVPAHTRALVDYVKVVDRAGKIIAFIDIGGEGDTRGDNRVPVNNENQWGDAKSEGNCTYRPVNEGNRRSQHSEFILMLDRLPRESPLRIIVRYKDSGDDLFPIEIFDGAEFRRIAQILLEDSGQWLEEEFKIPPVEIK